MESILKEFEKVEKAAPGLIQSSISSRSTATTSSSSRSSKPSSSSSSIKTTIPDSIDQLIETLERAKRSLHSSSASSSTSHSHSPNPAILLEEVSSALISNQKSISDRQKEFNTALSKLSKVLEKKFPVQVSTISDPNLFSGKEPQRALEAVVLEHLVRDNKWETASQFAKEAGLPIPLQNLSVFSLLHSTTQSLALGDLRPAIEWASQERDFLESRGSGLEFELHRSMFVRIALGVDQRSTNSESQPMMDRKGKGKKKAPNTDEPMETDTQEVEHQLDNGINDPDGERFDQSSDSDSSSNHHHRSNSNSSIQSNVHKALSYGRIYFKPFLTTHLSEVQKLFSFLLFLPTAAHNATNPHSTTHLGNGIQLDDSIMSFETARNDFDLDAELDLDREVKLDLNNPDNYQISSSDEMDVDNELSNSNKVDGGIDLPKPSPLHVSLISILPPPYRSLLHPNLTHAPFLLPIFKVEFCARAGVAKEPPLRIGVEVGAGGALNRIWKVRNMMVKSGNEWSQGDELPVEIPLPPHLRFHSTFACPVSKEQATEDNPPMMMACGHVVCLESLTKLGRREGLKCPYCPIESTVSQAIRVYF